MGFAGLVPAKPTGLFSLTQDSGPGSYMPLPTVPYRVLIADDAPAVRQALRWALEEAPEFELVGEAGDGESALAQARSVQPYLVLMDIDLPGGRPALVQALKALPGPPYVVCIGVNEDPEAQARASESGADRFVAKSAGWQALLAAIRSLLANP
jgi:DNA-binding NarL/FixJ family response regulator